MAVIFHLGSSGAGKSHNLYDMIIREAAKDFSRNFLLIVPEQFTLQTQRDMIAAHPEHGIMNIDVLSFNRMAHRVFEELGITMPMTLEDSGKSMIVRKVVLEHRDELGVYSGKVNRRGFIDEMKSVIAEFYQYGINRTGIDEMISLTQKNPGLNRKLRDIRVVYDAFSSFIDGRFIMNEEILDRLCECACESKVLDGACICFDGFTGFTAVQLKVMEQLMKLADIHITLTIDGREKGKAQNEESLFYLTYRTISAITALADHNGVEVTQEWNESRPPYRFRNRKALELLEHNIFRHPYECCGDSEGIKLVSCSTPVDEIMYVIGEIKRLVKREKYTYGEIAIVTGDVSAYAQLAEREFEKAGIPCFTDRKRSIRGSAPVELIKALIDTAASDYSYDSIFRLIKTMLLPVDATQIPALENYCIAKGIRGIRGWEKEWRSAYKSYYDIDLQMLNELGNQIISLTKPATEVLAGKNATVAERVAALEGFLESCKVREQLEEYCEANKDSADYDIRLRVSEYSQLYSIITEVLERITHLLGESVLDIKEFADILDTGFSEAKLAIAPQGNDSVLIGDIERTRLNSIRTLFFVGVNDSCIPKRASEGGILSDADRCILQQNDIELSPTKRQSTYLSEFYLYLNMTKPSDRLYLVYHRMDSEMNRERPAYIIGLLKKMYRELEECDINETSPEILVGNDCGEHAAADLVRQAAAGELDEEDSFFASYYSANNKPIFTRLVEAAFYERTADNPTAQSAGKLYNEILTGSVTRLEKFAACAFSHFVAYGLKLEERPEYKIGNLELGNIYHSALELYCRKLKANGIKWHDTTPEIRSICEKEAIAGAMEEYSDIFADSRRNEYIKHRLERIMSKTVEILDRQVRSGEFEPELFEQEFKHANEFMRLSGKIDRIDICEKNGKKYVRVVDYKSGSKTFDLFKLVNGLQIQLGVYMNESLKLVKGDEAECAGLYYYNIDDPIVEGSRFDSNEESLIRKQLKLSGPSNSTPENLILQDGGFAPDLAEPEEEVTGKKKKKEAAPLEFAAGYNSDVISVKTTKTGVIGKDSKIYTAGQFNALGGYLDKKIGELGEKIMSGAAEVNPYQQDSSSPCSYCSYKGICSFDNSLGDRYRVLEKKSEEELWQIINGTKDNLE